MTMCVEERGIKYLEQIYNYKSTFKLQELKETRPNFLFYLGRSIILMIYVIDFIERTDSCLLFSNIISLLIYSYKEILGIIDCKLKLISRSISIHSCNLEHQIIREYCMLEHEYEE